MSDEYTNKDHRLRIAKLLEQGKIDKDLANKLLDKKTNNLENLSQNEEYVIQRGKFIAAATFESAFFCSAGASIISYIASGDFNLPIAAYFGAMGGFCGFWLGVLLKPKDIMHGPYKRFVKKKKK